MSSSVDADKAKLLRIVNVKEDKLIVQCTHPEVIASLGLGSVDVKSGYVSLDIAEIAYIAYKSIFKILDKSGEPITFPELFIRYSKSKYDWIKFTVLLDLRERGRKAKSGFHKNSLIYTKGSSKVMVFVTEENAPLRSSLIVEWVRSALAKGYEPVLAVVDAHGDVTYYSMYPVRVEELRG